MGLCISRTNPSRIREIHKLETTPIVWITDIKTKEQSLNPTDIKGLLNLISAFIEKTENSIIFIEALSYLIDHNDFTSVLHMVQHIRDMVSEKKSYLLLYIDPMLLEEKQLKQLVQEVDEVRYRAY